MVLHLKEARKKNENLIAFRIPKELSVTLRKMGVNSKEVCLKALYEIANRNSLNQTLIPENQKISLIRENQLISWWTGGDLNP
ncbi:MAG: hypothetical protein QXI48_07565, partial [Candidatus Bathyarchaeia archaeon]